MQPPYSPSFPLSLCLPLPLVSISGIHLFYPLALHCFKVYIDSPREFCFGTLGLYILCFNQINSLPLFLTPPLSPCSGNIQQRTIQCIILYSYIDCLFQCFSFSNIFFISPPPSVPWDRLNNTILFSLWLYTYTYICLEVHPSSRIWHWFVWWLLSCISVFEGESGSCEGQDLSLWIVLSSFPSYIPLVVIKTSPFYTYKRRKLITSI
jgi:hypothetical protein